MLLHSCTYVRTFSKKLSVNTAAKILPSQENVRITTPEDCMAVYGQITSDDAVNHRLVVVALSYKFGKVEIVDHQQLFKPGHFSLYLPFGQYQIYAFSDINDNNVFENDECVGFYTASPMLSVAKNESQKRLLGPITVIISEKNVFKFEMPFSLKVDSWSQIAESKYYSAGTIRSLDDPIFSEHNGFLGLYEPAEFLTTAGGYLYALNELDTNKSPIIFVHGVGGTPRDFKYITENIDRNKFEPLFFYYPSGERLEMVADILYEIFLTQKVFDMKMKGRKVVICAHSMGGIVARAAINKYIKDNKENFLKAFITIATPFGGNDQAAAGVQKAPMVIPSWKDVASGSNFIKELYSVSLPEAIPFYLIFSYHSPKKINIGENNDGTIDLKSQLFPRAQFSAKAIYGFDETHTSILNSPEVVERLNQILSAI